MSKHILLLEDDPRDEHLVRSYLNPAEFDMTSYPSIQEAKAHPLKPDVIVADLGLIDTQGTETVKAIRELYPSTPLIILTGLNDDALGEHAIQLGAQTFIEKDILNRVRLKREIGFALERSRLDQISHDMLSEAHRQSEFKSQFLAHFSHEIRTPLNAVIGITSLIQNTPLNEEQTALLHALKLGGDRLLMIVNDILDISKIEAGRMQIERTEFNVRHLMAECLEIFAPEAATRGIFLGDFVAKDVPTLAISDAKRIKQIILNYLSNSFKYTAAGSIILSAGHVGNKLCFRVADTGCGLNQDQQKRLFEPFMQVFSKDSIKGTGLGLVVCKHLAALLGGEVGVESQEGLGSEFWFTVTPQSKIAADAARFPLEESKARVESDDPLVQHLLERQLRERSILVLPSDSGVTPDVIVYDARQHPTSSRLENIVRSGIPMVVLCHTQLHRGARIQSITLPYTHSHVLDAIAQVLGETHALIPLIPQDTTDFSNIQVLVVDDDELNRLVISKMLLQIGVQAKLASNGLEAVEACRLNHFDVVFMDCSMPKMDGFQASIEIKRHQTPTIVALTAHAFKEDRERCLASGMDQFLTKPVHQADVQMMLQQFKKNRAA